MGFYQLSASYWYIYVPLIGVTEGTLYVQTTTKYQILASWYLALWHTYQ